MRGNDYAKFEYKEMKNVVVTETSHPLSSSNEKNVLVQYPTNISKYRSNMHMRNANRHLCCSRTDFKKH